MMLADDIREHQDRCWPYVAVLQKLANDLPSDPLPPDIVSQVALATNAILAEAKAAGRSALALLTNGGHPATVSLLATRQTRLEHAAEDAVASAREAAASGNSATLRQRLRRFDALISAMWTVQSSV
jgi:hypothetical protein